MQSCGLFCLHHIDFVKDQQDAVLITNAAQFAQPECWRRDNTSLTLYGFNDDRSRFHDPRFIIIQQTFDVADTGFRTLITPKPNGQRKLYGKGIKCTSDIKPVRRALVLRLPIIPIVPLVIPW